MLKECLITTWPEEWRSLLSVFTYQAVNPQPTNVVLNHTYSIEMRQKTIVLYDLLGVQVK